MSEIISMDVVELMKIIPHRYPFLLVDKITECVAGKYSKGYKNLTINEAFFQGHFPNNPIFPGVLQIEAMAQVSAPILLTVPKYAGKLALFASMNGVRFKAPVRPGDKFEMEAILIKAKGPVGKCLCKGFVDGKEVVEAELTVVLQ